LIADPDDAVSVVQRVLNTGDHPEEISRMGTRARELGKKFKKDI
jgi:hypothetical protein